MSVTQPVPTPQEQLDSITADLKTNVVALTQVAQVIANKVTAQASLPAAPTMDFSDLASTVSSLTTAVTTLTEAVNSL